MSMRTSSRAEHDEGFRFGVNRSQPVRIGNIEGHRIDVSGSIGSQSVAGQITFIPHGGLMYRLMAVAPRGRWQSYLGRAHNVARSFRPLSDEERRSVEQVKLRVVAAQEGEGLAALGSRTGNAWDPGRTAVLNGVFVDARFGEGDAVKIARSAPYVPKPPSEEEEPADGDDASE